MKKLLILSALCLFLCIDSLLARPPTRPSEKMKFIGGSILQMVSFHAGGDFLISRLNSGALGADNKKFALNLGGSVGWNYFEIEDEEIDYGLRIKYHYTKSDYKTHNIGIVGYMHPYTYPIVRNTRFIQPLSFLVGAGYSYTQTPHGHNFSGGYVEAGIALFKYFPLNLDIVYRVSLYGKNSGIKAQNTHSVSLLFNVL